jgi:hypothetical protein
MHIIPLELGHGDLFCPVTGQRISGQQSYAPSPAQVGLWLGGLLERPEISCVRLREAWQHYTADLAQGSTLDMTAFFASVERPNHVCFAITRTGLGGGARAATVWYVIDMNYRGAQARREDSATRTPSADHAAGERSKPPCSKPELN